MTDNETIVIPADVRPDPEPDTIPGIGEPTAHPDQPTRNKGGRPKGSKTDPRTLEAARRRSGARQPKQTGRPSTVARTTAELTDQLAGGYEFVGSLLAGSVVFAAKLPEGARSLVYRLAAVGAAMRTNAEECAAAVVTYSERSPRLRRWLETSGQGAGIIALVVAHLPIALAMFGDVKAPAAGDPGDPATVNGTILFSPDDLAEATKLAQAMFAGGGFAGFAPAAGE